MIIRTVAIATILGCVVGSLIWAAPLVGMIVACVATTTNHALTRITKLFTCGGNEYLELFIFTAMLHCLCALAIAIVIGISEPAMAMNTLIVTAYVAGAAATAILIPASRLFVAAIEPIPWK